MNAFRWGALDQAIWGIAVVVLLLGFVALWAWRQAKLSELQKLGPLPEILDGAAGAKLVVRALLVVGAAALLVVALMRPQFGTKAAQMNHLGIDIAVVLDASKSMKVADVVPDRLESAKLDIRNLLGGLHGGRVGLVPFAGLAFIQTPLTTDHQVVRTYLDDLRVEDMPRGGTAIGRAILEGLRILLPPEALVGTAAETASDEDAEPSVQVEAFEGASHKAIILFTDGEDHEGDPIGAAELAAKLGVKIFTVGVGTRQGRPVPIINDQGQVTGNMKGPDGAPLFSGLNETDLRKIATMTGGQYFHLGAQGLGPGLGQALDALEKQEYEATYQALRDDRFQLAVLPAVLLLILEAWMTNRRRRSATAARGRA